MDAAPHHFRVCQDWAQPAQSPDIRVLWKLREGQRQWKFLTVTTMTESDQTGGILVGDASAGQPEECGMQELAVWEK